TGAHEHALAEPFEEVDVLVGERVDSAHYTASCRARERPRAPRDVDLLAAPAELLRERLAELLRPEPAHCPDRADLTEPRTDDRARQRPALTVFVKELPDRRAPARAKRGAFDRAHTPNLRPPHIDRPEKRLAVGRSFPDKRTQAL